MGGCCDKESRENDNEAGSSQKAALLSNEHRGGAEGAARTGADKHHGGDEGLSIRAAGASSSQQHQRREDDARNNGGIAMASSPGGARGTIGPQGSSSSSTAPAPAPVVKAPIVLDPRKLAAIVEHAEENFLDLDRSTLGVQRDDPEDNLDLLSRLRSVEVSPLAFPASSSSAGESAASSSTADAALAPAAFRNAGIVATFSSKRGASSGRPL